MRAGLLWAAAFCAGAALAAPATSQITVGAVTGGTVEGTVTDGVSTFLGIPFAAPPVGDLRWKAPQPVVPWTGTRKADKFGKACMQEPGLAKQMGYEGELSEDCLFIDLWTPAKAATERLPVIVWIYGGGYFSGMSSVPLYNGANFAKQGVVFVSVSYRVGPFGFLATPQLTAESGGKGSGNYGLLDMIAGLKWVQANIAKFGGDPAKVTIMGHSAGSNAVSRLAASPLAKGLFRGVIAESGANFSLNDAPLAAAQENGQKLLAGLGANDLAAARALAADQIQSAINAPGSPRFGPPQDGYVVPGNQVDLWKAKRFNDTAILIGHTSDEAAAFGAQTKTPEQFEADVKRDYGAGAADILDVYMHDSPQLATRAAKQLVRDAGNGWPSWTWARLQSTHGKGKAYVYYFDRPTQQNPDGSGHGSEVALVFANPDLRPGRAAWTDEDRAISRTMQSYWVNFAKTGNPNGAGLPVWPFYDEMAPKVMLLGAKTQADKVPNMSKLDAIDIYYENKRKTAAR